MTNMPAVLASEKRDPNKDLLPVFNKRTQTFDIVDLKTGKLVRSVYDIALSASTEYNEGTALLICERIRGGEALTSICKEEIFPSASTVYAWKALHPNFATMVEEAYRQRAEVFHDRALALATTPTHKDFVPSQKLAVETLKWAAGLADKRRYGKPEDTGVQQTSVTIKIDTGIRSGMIDTSDIVVNEQGELCESRKIEEAVFDVVY